MTTSHHSELGCLQDAASGGRHAGEETCRLGARRPCTTPDAEAEGRMEVKKHQHKHNLKHRYEVMETLGKGTYGKVKKAVERASLKTVSEGLFLMMSNIQRAVSNRLLMVHSVQNDEPVLTHARAVDNVTC